MEFVDLKSQQQKIHSDLEARIRKVLDHGKYILGPEIKELESSLARMAGVKHCISVGSGTDALLIALMALGVGPGDEVITSSFSFIASAEVVALLGAKAVFVDIDPFYNLDPEKLEKAISSRTKCVLPVSLYGQCACLEKINTIAKKNNITVIEDGAQSFGASRNGKKSCAQTTVGCTSFFPSKPLGCYGDGGACFTDNDELKEKMVWIRSHGQDKRYHHALVGCNGRMDTLQAAILLAKLNVFPGELEYRTKIAGRYSEELKESVDIPRVSPGNTHVYAQYTIQVPLRDKFQEKMKSKGIPTAIHYPIPLSLQPAFSNWGYKKGDFPVSERAAERVISLPMHPYLKREEQDKIIKSVKGSL